MRKRPKLSSSIFCICLAIAITVIISLPSANVSAAWKIVVYTISGLAIIVSAYEIFYQVKNKNLKKQNSPEYKKKDALITDAEKEFFTLLQKAVGDRYSIMQQVPLSSVVDKVTQNAFRNELFRTIDFCLVDKNTTEPKVLIEYNDQSHNRDDRKLRDEKVALICESAKIPLVVFWKNEKNTVDSIIKALKKALGIILW